ncbi:MAG: hypothetical protein MUE69_31745 [Myxococcota bacterium]|jgi:hypothetical protein|nr:hypothetical protein [Myxococcota bacterium]
MSTIPTLTIGGANPRFPTSAAAEQVAEAASVLNQPAMQQLREMAEAAGGWHALLGRSFDLASIRAPGLNEAVILLMMKQRLNDLDFQADATIRQIESATAKANAIQAQIGAVQDVMAAMANAVKDDDKRVNMSTLSLTLEDGTTVMALDYLAQAGVDPNSLGLKSKEDGMYASLQGMQSVESSLNGDLRTENSGNEMRTVQLQSVMQQRGQITQLGSNMLSSLNDTARAIIQNTK